MLEKQTKIVKLAIKKKVLLINIESESEALLINKISKKMNRVTSIGIINARMLMQKLFLKFQQENLIVNLVY